MLSLLPARRLVRTDQMLALPVSGWLEHLVAYTGTALLLGLGHAAIRPGLRVGLLAVYAVALELLQRLAPGRNPSVIDAAASAVGALLGTGLALAAVRRRR